MEPNQRIYCAAGDDTDYVEDREKYRSGGYHPIHCDDYLDSNKRFQVVHKLGWGESSTVWLCYDEKSRYYRSIKVMTTEESGEECRELQILKTLVGIDRKELADNYINVPREHFWIEGPNGRHLCFVSDLLGPSLFANAPDGVGFHTPESLTDLTFQVSKGLQYLHQKGICHGDLRPSNILMQLKKFNVMELSTRQLNRFLGPRQYVPLETLSGEDAKPHGPNYLVLPAPLNKLEGTCRTGKVAIVDFGDSFYCSKPPTSFRWHRQYAAPELLFTKTLSGFPQDIWALACTIYEIKLQSQLFSEYEDYTSLIRQMEVWFGPLPAEYRQLARNHLERDREKRLRLSNKNESSDSVQTAGDNSPDMNKPLSLSLEEEHRMRDMFVRNSNWENPLQASLGEEQICYVYERNDEGYTSSDFTEFDSDNSDIMDSDQASEDEGPQEDIYAQTISKLLESESLDFALESLDEEAGKRADSPLTRTPSTPLNRLEQSQDESQLVSPTPSTTMGAASQDRKSIGSGADSVTSPSSPQELGKRDANESPQGRGAKRQRMSEHSTEKGEWIQRVVRMPKEEVILLSDLLLRMFVHDPKERIDIDAVINHGFWGDRRSNWPPKHDDFIEDIPDQALPSIVSSDPGRQSNRSNPNQTPNDRQRS
ncbi:kinase-like domain-containing protein, partial [Jackrogersella minutella]